MGKARELDLQLPIVVQNDVVPVNAGADNGELMQKKIGMPIAFQAGSHSWKLDTPPQRSVVVPSNI